LAVITTGPSNVSQWEYAKPERKSKPARLNVTIYNIFLFIVHLFKFRLMITT